MNLPGARSKFEKNLRIALLLRATAYGFASAATVLWGAALDGNTGLFVREGAVLVCLDEPCALERDGS